MGVTKDIQRCFKRQGGVLRRTIYLSILLIFLTAQLNAQVRAFNTIFPDLPPEIIKSVFSNEGYLKSLNSASVQNLICKRPNALNPEIAGNVLQRGAGYYVEALLVVPGSKNMLDVYNALGKISGLKGILYQSYTKGESIPLFEEATRIESDKKNIPIPDPKPVLKVPSNETIFIRLKDTNFGNCYYRGDMVMVDGGLKYSLTNIKNLSFMLIPVIKEEKFFAQLYFEIIEEGVLVYSLTGAEVSDLVASKIDMPSAIRKRLEVIIIWVANGLKTKISG